MAAPVINPNQSLLVYGVGQDFTFRFVADSPVAEWMLDGAQPLPHGVVFHPASGTLMGAGTVPGIWQLSLTARNADGEVSDAVVFVVGIFETAEVEVVKTATIRVDTWDVTLPDPQGSQESAVAGTLRYGDDVVFDLQFAAPAAGNTPQEALERVVPKLRSARFSLRGDDTSPSFFTTDVTAFRKTTQLVAGVYETRFRLYVSLESAELAAWLGDYETESGTEADALAEFELEMERPSGAPGPATNKITTRKIVLRVRRDFVR